MTALRALAFALALTVAGAPDSAAFPGLDRLGDTLKKVEDTAGKVGRVAKGATGLSLEEEVAIGDAVSIEIVARFGGVWRDEEATKRVNLVGRALARYALRQDLDWRFGLLDSTAINAFSAPGGRVFITRGLYRMAGSDDQLAGILAHEIAHIDQRHALRIIARGELFGGVTELVADRNADFARYDQVVADITKNLLEKGFDPGTEYEADREGRALARTTGFASNGLRVILEALKRHEAGGKAETFSTHPSLDNRLDRLPKDAPAAPKG